MTVLEKPLVEGTPAHGADRPAAMVLIVDDMPAIRSLMAEVLQDAGFATIGARHGAEAWRLLKDEGVTPCAILLDVLMPVMDGWQFLHAARPSVPVILMSGVIADLPSHLPACVVRTLEKPIDARALVEAVRMAIGTGSGAGSIEAPQVRAANG